MFQDFSSLHERLSSCLSAPVPRCYPPAVVSSEPLPQISWYGSLLQRRRPPDLRTVGFSDPTPTLLPGTEILWMRLFDQRSDIGMGVMPIKLVPGPAQGVRSSDNG